MPTASTLKGIPRIPKQIHSILYHVLVTSGQMAMEPPPKDLPSDCQISRNSINKNMEPQGKKCQQMSAHMR